MTKINTLNYSDIDLVIQQFKAQISKLREHLNVKKTFNKNQYCINFSDLVEMCYDLKSNLSQQLSPNNDTYIYVLSEQLDLLLADAIDHPLLQNNHCARGLYRYYLEAIAKHPEEFESNNHSFRSVTLRYLIKAIECRYWPSVLKLASYIIKGEYYIPNVEQIKWALSLIQAHLPFAHGKNALDKGDFAPIEIYLKNDALHFTEDEAEEIARQLFENISQDTRIKTSLTDSFVKRISKNLPHKFQYIGEHQNNQQFDENQKWLDEVKKGLYLLMLSMSRGDNGRKTCAANNDNKYLKLEELALRLSNQTEIDDTVKQKVIEEIYITAQQRRHSWNIFSTPHSVQEFKEFFAKIPQAQELINNQTGNDKAEDLKHCVL